MTIHITFPENLPSSARRSEIEDALRASQFLILCGETGSGKTTQLPKIVLGGKVTRHDQAINHLMDSMQSLLAPPAAPKRQIGFITDDAPLAKIKPKAAKIKAPHSQLGI